MSEFLSTKRLFAWCLIGLLALTPAESVFAAQVGEQTLDGQENSAKGSKSGGKKSGGKKSGGKKSGGKKSGGKKSGGKKSGGKKSGGKGKGTAGKGKGTAGKGKGTAGKGKGTAGKGKGTAGKGKGTAGKGKGTAGKGTAGKGKGTAGKGKGTAGKGKGTAGKGKGTAGKGKGTAGKGKGTAGKGKGTAGKGKGTAGKGKGTAGKGKGTAGKGKGTAGKGKGTAGKGKGTAGKGKGTAGKGKGTAGKGKGTAGKGKGTAGKGKGTAGKGKGKGRGPVVKRPPGANGKGRGRRPPADQRRAGHHFNRRNFARARGAARGWGGFFGGLGLGGALGGGFSGGFDANGASVDGGAYPGFVAPGIDSAYPYYQYPDGNFGAALQAVPGSADYDAGYGEIQDPGAEDDTPPVPLPPTKLPPVPLPGDPDDGAGAEDEALRTLTTRYLRVGNGTKDPVTFYIRYRALNDASEPQWYPAAGDEPLAIAVQPGATSDVYDGKWHVNADRVKIWARTDNGQESNAFKKKALLLVPEVDADERHVYRAPALDTFVYTLTAGELKVGRRPNSVILLADDLGYADIGVQDCKDIPTANIDEIAGNGVRCTSGYVSCPYCSPTRAALMTGRYQQRFGHEFNPATLAAPARVCTRMKPPSRSGCRTPGTPPAWSANGTRAGQPDDIGPMIAALLSDDNRWINGQRIEVSGGMAL